MRSDLSQKVTNGCAPPNGGNQERRRHEIQETGRNKTHRKVRKASPRICPLTEYGFSLPSVPGTVLDVDNSLVSKTQKSLPS